LIKVRARSARKERHVSKFKFELSEKVRLAGSTEHGEVRGRAEYVDRGPPSYLVRYVAGDGRLVESWWNEDALEAGV
jgi:hypothetical protein